MSLASTAAWSLCAGMLCAGMFPVVVRQHVDGDLLNQSLDGGRDGPIHGLSLQAACRRGAVFQYCGSAPLVL